jgi:hypothetical protein
MKYLFTGSLFRKSSPYLTMTTFMLLPLSPTCPRVPGPNGGAPKIFRLSKAFLNFTNHYAIYLHESLHYQGTGMVLHDAVSDNQPIGAVTPTLRTLFMRNTGAGIRMNSPDTYENSLAVGMNVY